MNVIAPEPIQPARDHPPRPARRARVSGRSAAGPERPPRGTQPAWLPGDRPQHAPRSAGRAAPGRARHPAAAPAAHPRPLHGAAEAIALTYFARQTLPRHPHRLVRPLPTTFPDQARGVTGVDFALCGNPKPVMRGMLDFYGLPQRVTKVPGLWIENPPAHPGPIWLDPLNGRDLTYWTASWYADPATLRAPDSGEVRARLTRGHTGLPCDRAPPRPGPPPAPHGPARNRHARQAALPRGHLHRHGRPTGVWDPDTLSEWCGMLDSYRNSRKWSLTLLPAVLSDDLVTRLKNSWCGRVDFLFPSCRPALLQKYGCLLPPRPAPRRPARLKAAGVNSRAVFWIGGPRSPRRGRARLRRAHPPGSARPPRRGLSPLSPRLHARRTEMHGTPNTPDIDDWFRRAMAEKVPPAPVLERPRCRPTACAPPPPRSAAAWTRTP